jgi:hypothetical protein
MATTAEAIQVEDRKRTRTRSPAYPYINLETAIKRAKMFYEREGRNAAPVTVASKHWGMEPKSSAGAQIVAALISFGLMQDEGTGDKRKVKLSQSALKILLDVRPDSVERATVVKQAALSPKIHQAIFSRWGAGGISDDNLRHALIVEWEPPFNENTVDGFIREYNDTMRFAKVGESDKLTVEDGNGQDENGSDYTPQVGDYVNWESQGVLQTKQPIKVTGISTDGTHAFVGGSSTGLPVKQLSRATAPQGPPQAPIDHSVLRSPLPTTAMQEDVYSLPEGRIVIQWPSTLSQESIQDIKDWLKLVERKIARSQTPQGAQSQ